MVFSWCHHRLSFSVIMVVCLVDSCGNLLWEGLVEHLWSPIASRAVTCWHMKKHMKKQLCMKNSQEFSNNLHVSLGFSCCEIMRNPQTSHGFVEGVSSPRSLAASRSREAAGSWVARSRGWSRGWSPFITCFLKNPQFFHKVALFILCFYILCIIKS